MWRYVRADQFAIRFGEKKQQETDYSRHLSSRMSRTNERFFSISDRPTTGIRNTNKEEEEEEDVHTVIVEECGRMLAWKWLECDKMRCQRVGRAQTNRTKYNQVYSLLRVMWCASIKHAHLLCTEMRFGIHTTPCKMFCWALVIAVDYRGRLRGPCFSTSSSVSAICWWMIDWWLDSFFFLFWRGVVILLRRLLSCLFHI